MQTNSKIVTKLRVDFSYPEDLEPMPRFIMAFLALKPEINLKVLNQKSF